MYCYHILWSSPNLVRSTNQSKNCFENVFSRAHGPQLAFMLSTFNLNQKLAPSNSKDDECCDNTTEGLSNVVNDQAIFTTASTYTLLGRNYYKQTILWEVDFFCFKNSISQVKLQHFILHSMIQHSSVSVPPFQQLHPSCTTALPYTTDPRLTDGNSEE
uniref:Uncharacterized protein n=1 Tax=Glossina pallidipes TaxID=7398 RepID=A0A1A9ZKM9_GLOPL